MASVPSGSLGKILNKKSKLAAKPHGKSKSLFGEFGSALRDLITKPFLHESSRHSSTGARSNECKEGEKTMATTRAVVELSHADKAGTGDGPQMQEHSHLAGIGPKESREGSKVESLVEDLGSTLKDFLTPSFLHESPGQQSTNTDQNDSREEEKTSETKIFHMDDTISVRSVENLRTLRPVSILAEFGPKVIHESIKVELDFCDLLLIARSFSAKSSEVSARSCSFTCGVRQGSARDPCLFDLYATPHGVLNKTPEADYSLYIDEIQLFISFSPTISSDSIDHLRLVTQYCSW